MSLLLNIEMNQRSPPKVNLATILIQRTIWQFLLQHAEHSAAIRAADDVNSVMT